MSRSTVVAAALCLVASAAAVGAADQISARLSLQVSKGAVARYRSEQSSVAKFDRGEGPQEFKSESAVEYRLEVESVGEDGEVRLSVRIMSMRIRRAGRAGEFIFDSSQRDESSGEEIAPLRKLLRRKIFATVDKHGNVIDIGGLPHSESGRRGDGRGRLGRRDRVRAITFQLRVDLALIVGSGLQGKELKTGETYLFGPRRESRRRPRRPGDGREEIDGPGRKGRNDEPPRPRGRRPHEGDREGGGDRRGGGGGLRGAQLSLRLEAPKSSGASEVIAFHIVTPGVSIDRSDADSTQRKPIGAASFRKLDGLLEALTLSTSREFTRGKFTSSFTRTRKLTRQTDKRGEGKTGTAEQKKKG
jgi:hypothetical protein